VNWGWRGQPSPSVLENPSSSSALAINSRRGTACPGTGKAGSAAAVASAAPVPVRWVAYGVEKRERDRMLTSQGRKRGMHV